MRKMTILMTVLLTFVCTTCGNGNQQNTTQVNMEKGALLVYYFHGAQRCPTCRAIEENTIDLLNSSFAQAQQDGKLVFKVIDFSEPEGEAIADRYEVAFSSLILDKDGTVIDLTDVGFRYARNEPDTFKANLKTKIDKLLQ